MDGALGILIKLGVRLVVFGLTFFVAARLNPKVLLHNKWATPLIALVFATLNTALYWILKPVLNIATLGALGFVMPFIANMLFLYATLKIFEKKKWIEIQGMLTTLWMAGILTITHGVLWFALDYLPAKF